MKVTKPLPPFAKRWLADPPSAGIVVAIGPGAWAKAIGRSHTCLVLPDVSDPFAFRWPSNNQPALILETGPPNDARLQRMAEALIRAGAPAVVALRDSAIDFDPRVFFEVGKSDVAA